MSKHTPGPWYWSDKYQTTYNEKTQSLIGKDGYGILSCDGIPNSPDEPNARLIAAAPELLEALVVARDMVDDWASYASDYFRDKHDIKGDLAKLDMVIAKAKGGSHEHLEER